MPFINTNGVGGDGGGRNAKDDDDMMMIMMTMILMINLLPFLYQLKNIKNTHGA